MMLPWMNDQRKCTSPSERRIGRAGDSGRGEGGEQGETVEFGWIAERLNTTGLHCVVCSRSHQRPRRAAGRGRAPTGELHRLIGSLAWTSPRGNAYTLCRGAGGRERGSTVAQAMEQWKQRGRQLKREAYVVYLAFRDPGPRGTRSCSRWPSSPMCSARLT